MRVVLLDHGAGARSSSAANYWFRFGAFGGPQRNNSHAYTFYCGAALVFGLSSECRIIVCCRGTKLYTVSVPSWVGRIDWGVVMSAIIIIISQHSPHYSPVPGID